MIPNMFLLQFILGWTLLKGFSGELSVFLIAFYRKKVENLLQLELLHTFLNEARYHIKNLTLPSLFRGIASTAFFM